MKKIITLIRYSSKRKSGQSIRSVRMETFIKLTAIWNYQKHDSYADGFKRIMDN